MGMFDSSAAQFLGILEALWDSNRRPLEMRMPDEPEVQDVILELLSAGISLLSGWWKSIHKMKTLFENVMHLLNVLTCGVVYFWRNTNCKWVSCADPNNHTHGISHYR